MKVSASSYFGTPAERNVLPCRTVHGKKKHNKSIQCGRQRLAQTCAACLSNFKIQSVNVHTPSITKPFHSAAALRTKANIFYLYINYAPRSKHSPFTLYRAYLLFILRHIHSKHRV